MAYLHALCSTPESNKKKGLPGSKNHKWKTDRSLIKQKRMTTEEKWLFRDLLKEREFKCELTGRGGRLSIHHIKPVYLFPDERFNKANCIVILKGIHKLFHTLYGMKATDLDWITFIEGGQYSAISQ